MRIAVTGAGGFIGASLVRRLLAHGRLAPGEPAIEAILALDASLPDFGDPRVEPLVGSLPDPALMEALAAGEVDCVFHLAALPGGATAADYDLGWRCNVEASVDLLKRLAAQPRPARFVFASSIAVFGAPLPDRVDDATAPSPTMSYGAQKLIVEILINDMSRRGVLDGRSPRLPGIIARPRIKGGHISAYMSDILHALAAGEEFVCPVSPEATSWLMSRERCVDNLIRAATVPAAAFGLQRAFTLPALRLSMAELVSALAARFGAEAQSRVRYAPNPAIEAQFGAYPPLDAAFAERLGFRHDGDAGALIVNALGLAAAKNRPVRRIVTGHDENGKATVLSDGAPPNRVVSRIQEGLVFTEIWNTPQAPSLITRDGGEPTDHHSGTAPPRGGTVIRVVDIPPEGAEGPTLDPEQAKALFAAVGLSGSATSSHGGRHPLMHRTRSIDYGIVLSGEIVLLLDDDEVALKAGDIVVQRGTVHAWNNRGDVPCRMAFVLTDAEWDPELARQFANESHPQ